MRLETLFLRLQPKLLCWRFTVQGLGSRTEVVADVEKIHQIGALAAKTLFDLVCYPRRSIAHSMDSVAFAKAYALGTGA